MNQKECTPTNSDSSVNSPRYSNERQVISSVPSRSQIKQKQESHPRLPSRIKRPKLQLLANDIETAPLKRSHDLPYECGDVIRSIRDCNKTQTIRLMEHCLDQMNNKKLNKVKKELINYFDLRNINGQQFGRMDSKQFSNSIINHLGDEHKSLLNILRKLWVKMITFEFQQSVFNNENIQNVNNKISDFDSERMAQLLKNDILTNDKNEKLLKYKEEIIEYFVEFNVSGMAFNAMKAGEFVTNLRKHLKISNAKMNPALRALHESIKNYKQVSSKSLKASVNVNAEYAKDNKEINTSNTLLDDLSAVSDEDTVSQPLLIPHITHREVESIQNIESISECTNEQIVYILNEHIFDIINNEKLNPYKDKIIAFFKDNEIDGKKFIKMKRPQLGKDLVAATGAPNKMKSILIKVHKALKGCKPNELRPAKEEEEKEPNMCDIRNIDDCDLNQFVYVLRNYALCDEKLGELQEYGEQIIDYFVKKQIDGNKFNAIKRKDFAAKLLEHTKAKKTMRGKLLKLYGALSKWKNPNFVRDQRKRRSGTSNMLISRKNSTQIRPKPNENQALKPAPLDFNQVYEQQKLKSERVDEKANRKILDLVKVLTAEDLKEEEKASQLDIRSRLTLNPLKPNLYAETNVTNDESKEGEDDLEDEYPVYLNGAIFGKSEDEALEKLIDRAVLDVCYHPECEKLWDSKKFIDCVYSDVLFPNALNKVFETINDTVYNEYGFIGAFLNLHFKEEITNYLRKLNKKEEMERMFRPKLGTNVEKWLDDHERTQWAVSKEIVHLDTQCANFDISPKQNQNDFLMEFSAEDAFDANYSWAVFKRKRRPPGFGKDGVMEKTKGFWKVLEDEDYDSGTLRLEKSVHSKAEMFDWIKQVQKPTFGLGRSRKNSGFTSSDRKTFSADGGNVTTIYSAVSEMKKMKDTQNKKSKFQLIPLWHLNILFEFMLHQKASNKCHYKMDQDTISISTTKYILVFWNEMERTKCNSFIIKIGNDDREYYYMRYCHHIDKLRWDWYDYDNSKYKRFLSGGESGDEDAITKELEACYHANLEINFPRSKVRLYDKSSEPTTKFQHCHLLQLKKFVNPNSEQQYVLRFTINERSPFRITNMEQCAYSKYKQPFPRNVRRLINGRNTIDFDGQKTNDYIEEWKKRYLLQTLQQQKYFFCHILSICAVVKYIEIELSYQMISSPGKKDDGEDDDELFSTLNDSHVRKRRVDFEVSEGFFVPPRLGIIDRRDETKKAPTILSMNEFRLYDSENVIVRQFKKLADDDEYFQHLLQNNHKTACNHVIGDDVLWELHSVLPDADAVYCNDCAKLILFSEYIKKYVLESENNEACEQLWPWYRNYFRREDHGEERYYFKNISKHNMANLYDISKCLWKENVEDTESEQSPEEQKSGCCKLTVEQVGNQRNGMRLVSMIESTDAEMMEKVYPKRRIRHHRKFVAHVMLNSWDIIRNMNILRMQLAWIEKYIEVNDEEKSYPSGDYWGAWKDYMDECNEYLTWHDPDWSSIRPENDFDDEKVDLYKRITVSLFDAITKDPKCNLYNPQNDTIDDKLTSIDEEKIKLEQQIEYFTKFKSVWQAVPVWWNEHSMKYEAEARSVKASVSYYNYDHLLLQLALVYNLDIDKYAESLKNDPMDKLGFTQFLEWIKDWRNVQHRLRYLTFIICKYLKQCERNIEDLKLDSKYQISQYKSRSIIFLNGYMHHVHRENCESVQLASEATVEVRQQILDTNRKKDPFMSRNLENELAQIFRSMNVCKYGEYYVESILHILTNSPRAALWTALEMLIEILPFKITKCVLIKHQYLLVLQPIQRTMELANAMLRSTSCTVEVCLFLTTYMQQNAKIDVNRHEEWMEVSESFNKESTKVLSSIESELLLLLYVTMPRYQISDQPLFNTALKTKCTQFFNNPKITTLINHIWECASPHNPHRGIAFTFQQMTINDKLHFVADKPFKYYLSPMGLDASSKLSHFLYLIAVYSFIATRKYLTDPIGSLEWIVWSFNFGFIVNEFIECHSKGITEYFAIFGWVNVWDILISIVWIICFGIRMFSVTNNYKDYSDLNAVYVLLWAIQAASLSVRSLAWFQTSPYSGSLLRIIVGLYREIVRFLLILSLFLLGYVFGLYYIDGGYEDKSGLSIFDWYEHFKYMFELTLAMQEIPDTNIAIQLFIMTYVFCGTILLLNLLIAIMTKAFEHLDEKTSSEMAYTKAEAAMEMSYKSRFLPAPFCVFVFGIALIIHIINFVPAMLSPRANIYKYINHQHYKRFYEWRCRRNCCSLFNRCKKPESEYTNQHFTPSGIKLSVGHIKKEKDVRYQSSETDDTYRMVTRKRICRYYLATICCCFQKELDRDRFISHHKSCYSTILTRRGSMKRPSDRDGTSVHGMSIENYLDEHSITADEDDINLLNKFGQGAVFCLHCYRPFHPKDVHKQLISPFWAMAEIISVYSFIVFLYVPLLIAYLLGSVFEKLKDPAMIIFETTLDKTDDGHEYYDAYHEGNKIV